MTAFMLETDVVSSSSDTIESIASQITSLSDGINGYDVGCDDFDFSSAKNVIAQNLEACSTKVQNTADYLNSVVTSHTQLQNSLSFQNSVDNSNFPSDSASESTAESESNYSGNSSSGYSSSPSSGSSSSSYVGGSVSGYSGGISSGYSSNGYDSSLSSIAAFGMVPSISPTETVENNKEIEAKFERVSYAYLDMNTANDEVKELFQDSSLKYDDGGYAIMGERYVIACDSSIGKVGDVIQFTLEDGTVLECVVGVNTVSDKYKKVFNFIIDKDKSSSIQALDVGEELLKDATKAKNLGNIETIQTQDLLNAVEENVKKSALEMSKNEKQIAENTVNDTQADTLESSNAQLNETTSITNPDSDKVDTNDETNDNSVVGRNA